MIKRLIAQLVKPFESQVIGIARDRIAPNCKCAVVELPGPDSMCVG